MNYTCSTAWIERWAIAGLVSTRLPKERIENLSHGSSLELEQMLRLELERNLITRRIPSNRNWHSKIKLLSNHKSIHVNGQVMQHKKILWIKMNLVNKSFFCGWPFPNSGGVELFSSGYLHLSFNSISAVHLSQSLFCFNNFLIFRFGHQEFGQHIVANGTAFKFKFKV